MDVMKKEASKPWFPFPSNPIKMKLTGIGR